MKKLLVLMGALSVAMAVLGVGYALWFDLLNLGGTVVTGNVGIEWSLENPNDDGTYGYDTDDLVVLGGSAARTYTLNADFDEGLLVAVNHDSPNNNQLQLDSIPTPFDFIWVAVSSKGTTVKIDVNTGAVLGEYRTAPSGMGVDPSRTTVDNNGSVWVTNRAEYGFVSANAIAPGVPTAGGGMGSLVHIGLEENGECVDRNVNGVIDTSTGLGDIRAWTNAGGANSLGGVSTAADECIIHYTRVNSTGTRHVSVDASNNVWVSGIGDRDFDKVSGTTGAILTQAGSVGYGGYGGLIAPTGVIWSARPLLRWDTALPLTGANGDPAGTSIGPALAGTNWAGQISPDSYGLCINPNNGEVWNTRLVGDAIDRYAPSGAYLGTYAHGAYYAQGCVVDSNGHVWVANSLYDSTVGHLDAAGTFLGNVAVGSGPTGVAVDANGKVWATNYSSRTASRIDPALAGGVGAVDFTTVDLGGNLYNYSDMTGSTLIAPPGNGTWTIVNDCSKDLAVWGTVSWNASTPGDSSIIVNAASSNDGVLFGALMPVTNGVDLTVPDGRYLKVVTSFTRSSTDADGDGVGDSPILYDMTIACEGGVVTTAKNVSGISCTLLPDAAGKPDHVLVVTLTNAYPSIDYYCDIDIHDTGSIPVHIEALDIAGPPPLAVPPLLPMPLNSRVELNSCRYIPNPASGGATVDLPGSLLGVQLHPSDRIVCTLRVHLYNWDDPDGPNPGPNNGAMQLVQYGFTGSVYAVQYNESAFQ